MALNASLLIQTILYINKTVFLNKIEFWYKTEIIRKLFTQKEFNDINLKTTTTKTKTLRENLNIVHVL
jgi:DNA-binding HxlR family transcriptional regulator